MTHGETRLAERTALVTGGATGIGRATALRLATEGAAVVVNYIGDRARAEQVVEQIREAGGRAVAIEADVSDEAQVDDRTVPLLTSDGA